MLPAPRGRIRSLRRPGARRGRGRGARDHVRLRLPVRARRSLAVRPHAGQLLPPDLPAPFRSRHRHLFRRASPHARPSGHGRDHRHDAVPARRVPLPRPPLHPPDQGAAPIGRGDEPDSRLGGRRPLPPGHRQRHRVGDPRKLAVAGARGQPDRRPLAAALRGGQSVLRDVPRRAPGPRRRSRVVRPPERSRLPRRHGDVAPDRRVSAARRPLRRALTHDRVRMHRRQGTRHAARPRRAAQERARAPRAPGSARLLLHRHRGLRHVPRPQRPVVDTSPAARSGEVPPGTRRSASGRHERHVLADDGAPVRRHARLLRRVADHRPLELAARGPLWQRVRGAVRQRVLREPRAVGAAPRRAARRRSPGLRQQPERAGAALPRAARTPGRERADGGADHARFGHRRRSLLPSARRGCRPVGQPLSLESAHRHACGRDPPGGRPGHPRGRAHRRRLYAPGRAERAGAAPGIELRRHRAHHPAPHGRARSRREPGRERSVRRDRARTPGLSRRPVHHARGARQAGVPHLRRLAPRHRARRRPAGHPRTAAGRVPESGRDRVRAQRPLRRQLSDQPAAMPAVAGAQRRERGQRRTAGRRGAPPRRAGRGDRTEPGDPSGPVGLRRAFALRRDAVRTTGSPSPG